MAQAAGRGYGSEPGNESGQGPGGPLGPVNVERPLGATETMVDRLKAAGRNVGDQEWRLGMLGAIATGRGDKLSKLMRHSDGTATPDGEGHPGPRPRTC